MNVGTGSVITCPACASAIEISAFPAFFRGLQGISTDELALSEGLASCFYHATKRAAACCNHCGKFLCALCTLESSSQTWCPECLARGSNEKRIPGLERRRTLWDTIALGCAVIPSIFAFFFYFWIFTAPATIFLSIKYWKRPSSIVPRTKIRFVLAIAIALLQLAVLSFVIYSFLRVNRLEVR